jgi:hypothetical protein
MKDMTKLDRLPSKRLAAFIRKNPDIVEDIDYEGGFMTATGYAYDVLLAEGWGHTGLCDHMHTIIEPRATDVIDYLKTAERCADVGCTDT